jgi:Saxitoxin biosynthesis operon protein SxtJ
MIVKEIKELKTGPRELRKFGLLVGGVFAVLGIIALLRGKHSYPWLLGPGVLLMGFGAVWPTALKWIYLAWMSVAVVLGFVVSHVLLMILFYLAFLPLGLLARCFGKDFLRLKLDPKAGSYWIRRPASARPAEEYERQY